MAGRSDGPNADRIRAFDNVAIVADTDRMYHRIGRIGPADAMLPRMSATAEIRLDADGGWSVFDQNECRARYPREALRLSVVWRADVLPRGSKSAEVERLTGREMLRVFQEDLWQRGIPCGGDLALLHNQKWIESVYRLYMGLAKQRGPATP